MIWFFVNRIIKETEKMHGLDLQTIGKVINYWLSDNMIRSPLPGGGTVMCNYS